MLAFNARFALFVMAGLLGLPMAARSAPSARYETGYQTICRISRDLCKALPAANRSHLTPEPILLDDVSVPFIQPGEYKPGTNRVRYVSISAGFIDFLNYLAHASAVDSIDRGCYSRYLESLTTQTGEHPLLPPRLGSPEKSWSLDIMNHQTTHFNQMVAALVAIDMAHHYLGHYHKYAARLIDARGNAVPINTVLTHNEWHDAVMKGARNALDCGFSTDGLKLLFESLEKMKARPVWTIYFVSDTEETKQITRELKTMEKEFFAN
jgi:hypothetical protein